MVAVGIEAAGLIAQLPSSLNTMECATGRETILGGQRTKKVARETINRAVAEGRRAEDCSLGIACLFVDREPGSSPRS